MTGFPPLWAWFEFSSLFPFINNHTGILICSIHKHFQHYVIHEQTEKLKWRWVVYQSHLWSWFLTESTSWKYKLMVVISTQVPYLCPWVSFMVIVIIIVSLCTSSFQTLSFILVCIIFHTLTYPPDMIVLFRLVKRIHNFHNQFFYQDICLFRILNTFTFISDYILYEDIFIMWWPTSIIIYICHQSCEVSIWLLICYFHYLHWIDFFYLLCS